MTRAAGRPKLSVVVIGRNEGERLVRCLESVRDMAPIDGPVEVLYVDSDSTDGSPARAAELGARVIEVHPTRPSAALGRNAGWREARAEVVLFLDGDTILDRDFVASSLAELDDPRVAVVWGHRREIHPEASVYNRVLDLDWVYPPGETEFCGGDALMRRAALECVEGFDDELIAGEEPDMCRRLRAHGFTILHVDRPMTGHDLAITRFSQYWTRAERAGHAYAEVAERFRGTDLPLWDSEVKRNRLHGLGLLAIAAGAPLASLVSMSIWPLLAGLALLAILVARTAGRVRWKSDDPLTRLLYAVHSHLQQIPILVGQLRFARDRRAGRRRRLIEYKEAPSR